MRKFPMALAGLLASLAAAAAQSPTQAAGAAPPPPAAALPGQAPVGGSPALRLIEMMQVEETLDPMFATLMPLAADQTVSLLERNQTTSNVIADLVERLPRGRQRLVEIMTEEFQSEFRKRYPQMKAELAALYESRFTAAELEDMLRFFSSGAGAKYLTLQPELQAHMRTVGQGIGRQAGEIAAPNALDRAQSEAGEGEIEDRSS